MARLASATGFPVIADALANVRFGPHDRSHVIARADALYGVTMEEHGVSKLVGVKFSTREKNGNGGDNDVLSSSEPSHVPSVAETFGKSGDLHSESLAAAGAA